jgi:taurine dioxygenase
MSFEIWPLSDALGAEVVGLDLSAPLDDETFARVHRAHLDHLVLVFRDQALEPGQQVAFSKRFGSLDQHPADHAVLADHPDVLLVSTRKEKGEYIGLPDAGPMWHSDLAYKEITALGSMLYALELPDHGGDTSFANMYAAYEALPADLAAKTEGRRGVYLSGRVNQEERGYRIALSAEQNDRTPPVLHPIVRTHPETGRKSIFANPQHTRSIEGLDEGESREILDRLFAHCAEPEFVYRHRWRLGDLVFWDNRCTQHIADQSRLGDPAYRRHMHRTTIMGDRPV